MPLNIAGGKKKPLKAAKKDVRELDDHDMAEQAKRRQAEKAEKEAREKLLKGKNHSSNPQSSSFIFTINQMTKRKDASRIADLKVKLTPAEQEKARTRAERFGIVSEEVKAKRRAAKFGTFHPQLYSETLKRRAARFAGPTNTAIGPVDHNVTAEERERRIRRAERFGTSNADLEAEKKKRRAERFNAGQKATLDHLNKHLTEEPDKPVDPATHAVPRAAQESVHASP